MVMDGQDLQVGRAIVVLDAVDVVYLLIGAQHSPQPLLYDQPVLILPALHALVWMPWLPKHDVAVVVELRPTTVMNTIEWALDSAVGIAPPGADNDVVLTRWSSHLTPAHFTSARPCLCLPDVVARP